MGTRRISRYGVQSKKSPDTTKQRTRPPRSTQPTLAPLPPQALRCLWSTPHPRSGTAGGLAPPPVQPCPCSSLPVLGEIRLEGVRVRPQSKGLEVPVQCSERNPKRRSQAALCGAVVQRDITEARAEFFEWNASLAAVSLATVRQLWAGDPCFMLLIVPPPQSLNRFPTAAELLRGCRERTVLQHPVVAASEEEPNHLFFRSGEILAFCHLGGTPGRGHASPEERKASDRRFKVGVMISSDFCWGGKHVFGGKFL